MSNIYCIFVVYLKHKTSSMQKKAQTEKETRLQLKIEEQKKEISSLKKQLRKKDASRKSDAAMVKELKSELKNARRENEDIKKRRLWKRLVQTC